MNHFISGLTDGTEEPDYFEQDPEPEGYRFPFRDGSAVTIYEDQDPDIEATNRGKLAYEFLEWWEENAPEYHVAVKYLNNNYK